MPDPRKEGGGWLAVDFDGVLAHHDHYRGENHFGKPIEPMVRKVRKWIREGKDVRLFTARKPTPALRRWMEEHLGKVLPITKLKDRFMQGLWDDRAVGMKKNTGEPFHPDNETQVFKS